MSDVVQNPPAVAAERPCFSSTLTSTNNPMKNELVLTFSTKANLMLSTRNETVYSEPTPSEQRANTLRMVLCLAVKSPHH